MGARFADRIGKGIRGSPRDAMIADETPPEIRGRAFGLRQALDTAGALLAPLVAIGLMWLFASNIRVVYWIAIDPGRLVVPARLDRTAGAGTAASAAQAFALLRGFRELDKDTKRLLAVGFLFTLARFSEAFLILKGIEIGLSEALSPLRSPCSTWPTLCSPTRPAALSDRMSPKSILMAGIAVLIVGNVVLANTESYAGLALGVGLWGAHMALTQGIFSRMVADSALEQLRATSFGAFWFVTGIGALLASLGAGLAMGSERQRDHFRDKRGNRSGGARHA